jgi:CubicO group peptidase (beta-lactamase class C family)
MRAPERLPRTLALIEEGMAAGTHVGVQLYVSLHGETVADIALGLARPGVRMTTDTLMAWFSCTKAVTAVALLKIWDEGRLDLDDRVTRYIPEFGQGGKEAITIRHVLTHTGGFRGADQWTDGSGRGPFTSDWDAVIAKISTARIEPRWIPGAKAGYHPTSGMFVLGEIVRRLDGRPFAQYVREAIFEPLDMRDCWISLPPDEYHRYGDRIGIMYATEGTEPRAAGPLDGVDAAARAVPGGSGRGPMRELGRFYEMLLNRGTLGGVGVLSVPAVEALSARHRTGMFDHTFGHIVDWGLGVVLNSNLYGAETVPYGYGLHASPRAFGHSGRQSSTAFADPEHGLAVALVFNGMPGEEAHQRRIRPVLTALYEDLDLAAAGVPALQTSLTARSAPSTGA